MTCTRGYGGRAAAGPGGRGKQLCGRCTYRSLQRNRKIHANNRSKSGVSHNRRPEGVMEASCETRTATRVGRRYGGHSRGGPVFGCDHVLARIRVEHVMQPAQRSAVVRRRRIPTDGYGFVWRREPKTPALRMPGLIFRHSALVVLYLCHLMQDTLEDAHLV